MVVAGTHSDVSSSSSGATLSATVNVSNNGNNGSSLFAPVSMPILGGLNESAVIRIVKEALLKYDADKTGMVDHALESAGGNVVSTRCTESYQVRNFVHLYLIFSFIRKFSMQTIVQCLGRDATMINNFSLHELFTFHFIPSIVK